jgi:hypothetical protein
MYMRAYLPFSNVLVEMVNIKVDIIIGKYASYLKTGTIWMLCRGYFTVGHAVAAYYYA